MARETFHDQCCRMRYPVRLWAAGYVKVGGSIVRRIKCPQADMYLKENLCLKQ